MSSRSGITRACTATALAMLSMAGLVACPALDELPSPGRDAAADGADASDGSALDSSSADTRQLDGVSDADAPPACLFIDASFIDAVTPPDGACAPPDGGSCTPTFDPSYLAYLELPPPRAHLARCTKTQISDYLQACPIPYPEAPASSQCQMFASDTNNATCLGCLSATDVANPGAGAGPILFSPFGPTDDVAYNYFGCVELVEPCNTRCARAMWVGYECPIISCYPACALPDVPACAVAAAGGCPCAAEVAAEEECVQTLMASSGPASQCLVPSGVLQAFCGM